MSRVIPIVCILRKRFLMGNGSNLSGELSTWHGVADRLTRLA